MKATIVDVARQAGVSTATVSHVINQTRFVSDDLRDKVLQAMRDLNYRQNSLARSLRMGETRTIGLIVPDNSNPFFAEILHTIENIGFTNGYSVILCNSANDPQKEAAYINVLHAKQVDGLIFISTSHSSETLAMLGQQNEPTVIVDRDIALEGVDVVLVDNVAGGAEATRHLIELGHTRIACLTGPSLLTPSAGRVRGFYQAMAQAGLPVNAEYVIEGDFLFQSGETALQKLMALPEPPSALFACNDMMALGALQALGKLGLTCPRDLSIVGFDDIPLTTILTPALTTVAQPIEDIAAVSVNLLMNRIQHEADAEPQRFVLPTRLIARDSSAACRVPLRE
ncbi:MAG TPA: LacI family DNA-binding transcriptional regulator [Anaerolineaceae bacterium]|nr:LacI family DNA-binding transcriptional regulator [Anaerolineaceae bacterium]